MVVVKKFVFFIFPFGPACWLWGTLFIDRQNFSQTKMQLDKECEEITSRSKKILIFPEGHRSQVRLVFYSTDLVKFCLYPIGG